MGRELFNVCENGILPRYRALQPNETDKHYINYFFHNGEQEKETRMLGFIDFPK